MAEALARLLLEREVERFFYAEATLLDERRFADWLDLLADDIHYFMPIARNVRHDDAAEYTRAHKDAAWFDEGKETLTQRVKQIATGLHWAEEPRSRVSHLVTNIEVVDVKGGAGAEEVATRCRFLVCRNRQADESDVFVGKRHDVLVRSGPGWKIRRREILLDQNVLLAKNLTTFF
jgi:3-phenylpropionate/cinnamic acid dioxygenase small subunit